MSASRALQHVLFRSAKQDQRRRFHALYDKVARRLAYSSEKYSPGLSRDLVRSR
jgi:hypothetical protein